MNSKLIILLLCIITFAKNSYSQPQIRLNKINWAFDEVVQGSTIDTVILIKNSGKHKLNLNARSSCDCISVSLSKDKLLSNQIGELFIKFDTSKYQGNIQFFVFINSNDPQNQHLILPIEGYIKPLGKPIIRISLFASSHCNTCHKIINQLIPKYEKKYNIRINTAYYLLNQLENYEKLISLEQKLGDINNKLPVIIIGNKILGGEKEILENLETYINKSLQKKKIPLEETKIERKIVLRKVKIIQLVPIFLAGFVDGLNPCAFVTIIFLLSYLVFIGREKNRYF